MRVLTYMGLAVAYVLRRNGERSSGAVSRSVVSVVRLEIVMIVL